MTITEIVSTFKEKYPYRRPMKYARSGNTWYLFTENTANGGQNLSVIENGYYSVEGNKVLPVIPLDMPRDLTFTNVPVGLRKLEFEK